MVPVSDVHQSQLNVAQQDPSHGAASSTVTIEHLPGESTLQPRTDTGWAWVVLLGAVVVNFVAFGASASLSVYLNVWMEYFDVSAVTVGFVLSFRTLIKTLMGESLHLFNLKQNHFSFKAIGLFRYRKKKFTDLQIIYRDYRW